MNLRNNFSSTVEGKKEQQQVVRGWRARLKVVKEAKYSLPSVRHEKKNHRTESISPCLVDCLVSWPVLNNPPRNCLPTELHTFARSISETIVLSKINEKNMVAMNTLLLNLIHGSE